ncbi:MAG: alpha/beta fold hydrolase [Myxococcaceae bacterium]|nr:alpha/beta fold hydrolase [Myxococcaceae bacterium]
METAAPAPESVAAGIIDALKVGRSQAAHARLGVIASAAIDAAALQQAWDQAAKDLGKWKSTKRVQALEQAGLKVFVHDVQFEKGVVEVTTAVDPKQQKAEGFFVKPLPPPAEYTKSDAFKAVEVTVGKAPWALPGTLTVPAKKGPFPAVVLVHGSGPNDRDETVGVNRPFKDLAEGLATKGVVVLRYDKRTRVHGKAMTGVVTVDDEVVLDALAAVELLMARADVDKKNVWVLGHSLGAQLAPEIGARAKGVKGVVLLGAPARKPWESIPAQLRHVGADAKTIAEVDAQCAALKNGTAKGMMLGAPVEYWLEVGNRDGIAAAKALGKPVLALFGERDYQVTVEDAELWKAGLEGVPQASVEIVPKANHLFIAGEGVSMPAEYSRPGHVMVEVVERIATKLRSDLRSP